jgi:hypothetical protein
LRLHLAEVLDDDTSGCRVGARIHADAHVHRQLRVGPAVVTPDMFEHYSVSGDA